MKYYLLKSHKKNPTSQHFLPPKQNKGMQSGLILLCATHKTASYKLIFLCHGTMFHK